MDSAIINKIVEAFFKQIPLYAEYPDEKGFLYLALGLTLELTNDPMLVSRALDAVFSSVNHSRIGERQACATAFGKVSSSHFELIVSKLDA